MKKEALKQYIKVLARNDKILDELLPLWRKEHNESELCYPSTKDFYRWIVNKIDNNNESIINSNEQVWWKPICNKNIIFNNIHCYVRSLDSKNRDWIDSHYLFAVIHKDKLPYRVLYYNTELEYFTDSPVTYCRILPFSEINSPPSGIVFEHKGNIFTTTGYVDGIQIEGYNITIGLILCNISDCQFTGFDEAMFEIMEE